MLLSQQPISCMHGDRCEFLCDSQFNVAPLDLSAVQQHRAAADAGQLFCENASESRQVERRELINQPVAQLGRTCSFQQGGLFMRCDPDSTLLR